MLSNNSTSNFWLVYWNSSCFFHLNLTLDVYKLYFQNSILFKAFTCVPLCLWQFFSPFSLCLNFQEESLSSGFTLLKCIRGYSLFNIPVVTIQWLCVFIHCLLSVAPASQSCAKSKMVTGNVTRLRQVALVQLLGQMSEDWLELVLNCLRQCWALPWLEYQKI